MLAAIGAFLVTRAVAANNRDMSVGDAAEWYSRGERALADGRVADAVDAFRRATVRNRGETSYVLALARALAQNRDDEAARGVLLTLRDAMPEDAEVNLELARIAANRHDVTEAVRFYHNALYAPWAADRADDRRAVRFELIRFLLGHSQAGRALSELLAVASDLPDRPAAHVEVGQLFARAGDDAHALDQFQRALRLAPDDPDAIAAAGEAAFRLGQYPVALPYLRRVHTAGDTRQVAELVIADDPLASRIRFAERRRRLASNVEYVRERLTACPPPADEGVLRDVDEAATHPAADQDAIEAGAELVDRIARHLADACQPPAARDRALALIGREHSGASK